MKKIFFLLSLILITTALKAQYIHKIKGDSVLITNDSCSAELNIENSTKLIKGFLYNRGNGRTEFRRGMIKINDSLYLFGNDTLNLKAAISLAGGSSVNIFNSNGTLTGNRFLDLGSSSLSIGKSSSTNFSVFNNGLSWFGNGTPTAEANGIHSQHLITASSGNAKGLYINDSMIASANNDTLVALDINPGYNNNSFTGVSNIDLRTKNGNVVFGSGVGYGKYHGIANDGILQLKTEGGNKTQLWFRPASNANGNNGNYWGKIEIETYKMSLISPNYGALHVQNAGTSYGLYLGGWSSNYAMYIHSQTRSVNIGGFNTDDSTAILKVVSTTRGFLPPVWTQAQRLAIDGISPGLMGYQSNNNENLYIYKSTGWKKISTEDDLAIVVHSIYTNATADITLTNQANSEQDFYNNARTQRKGDLSGKTSARIVCRVTSASNSVNTPRLYLQYSTDGTTWSNIGNPSTPTISLASTGFKDTDWFTITSSAAVNNIYFRVAQNGGNGNADPDIAYLEVMFK